MTVAFSQPGVSLIFRIPYIVRWELYSYGPCSVDCGGGIQQRRVKCVMQVGRNRAIMVNTHRCPDPIPRTRRSCNLRFCPAYWETGEWTQVRVDFFL